MKQSIILPPGLFLEFDKVPDWSKIIKKTIVSFLNYGHKAISGLLVSTQEREEEERRFSPSFLNDTGDFFFNQLKSDAATLQSE